MRLSRIYTPQPLGNDTSLVLNDETAHYVSKVLRMRPGELISLFNGTDGERLALIQLVDKKSVTVLLQETVPCQADPRLPIHLGLGLSRGERMDYAIQKATETGVSSITPLLTERCEVKLKDERTENRLKHWERVAISACEQSGRCAVPVIHPPVTLTAWLQEAHAAACYVLDHRTELTLNTTTVAPPSVSFLVGPEGGLSEDEITAANAQGFASVRIGPRVLRTETAPIVAITLAQHLWGDYR